MADRYDWDRDRSERDREREQDWERGREGRGVGERWGEGRRWEGERSREHEGREGYYTRPGREDWDRTRWGGEGRGEGRYYGEGRHEERGRSQPSSGENRIRDNWNRSGEPGRQESWYGERNTPREDWGNQGAWGTFGNRGEHERDYGQRRGQEWGESERRGAQMSTFGGGYAGAPGAYGGWAGGLGSFGGGLGNYGERQGLFAGRGPKGWQRSDERIREDVNERLTQHPHVDATEIDVQVKGGEVTLTGTVDHRDARRMAEDVAESVSGVKDVHNQIRVQQPQAVGAGVTGLQTGQAGQSSFPGGQTGRK
jgi:hypothetical protein